MIFNFLHFIKYLFFYPVESLKRKKFSKKNFLEIQKKKWSTIPGTIKGRANSLDLLKLEDQKLIKTYNDFVSKDLDSFNIKYFNQKYLNNKKIINILDLGCGLGRHGFYFIDKGFQVTFADIVPSNIDLVTRIAKIKKIEIAKIKKIETFDDYRNFGKFDLIWASGSLHHNPIKITRSIIRLMNENFESGKTRFFFLSYPYERWRNSKFPPFYKFGDFTDGGAPWTEFYNKRKIRYIFDNKIDILNETKFNNEFIAYDIIIK